MRRALALALLSILMVAGWGPTPVYADVNDFVVNNLKAEYAIDNSKPGGTLDAVEQIDVTFSDQNHGIYRYMPTTYRDHNTKIKIISVERNGQPEQFKIEDGDTTQNIRIGNPDVTMTGKQSYRIHYTQERIINFQTNPPSFYWDVNGNLWQQPFEAVSARVTVKGTQLDVTKAQCYTGAQGSQTHDCTVSQEGVSLIFASTRPFGPNENLSVETQLGDLAFVQPTTADDLKDALPSVIYFALGLVPGAIAALLWFSKGRDSKGKGVIVPEFEPPEGLSPAEVGMMADLSVDGKDVSATIIDLAIRGYVRIHDNSKKILFFNMRSFGLELLNTDTIKLRPYETTLLRAMFEPYTLNTVVEVKKLDKTRMHTAVESARKQIENNMEGGAGLIDKTSSSMSKYVTIASFVVIGVCLFAPGVGWFRAGLVISAVAGILFGTILKRRSALGVEVNEHIKGLKLYLNVAEKDRLKMLQSVDRPYAEPSKTVELFEKLLPYAVALGVEKSWAKQFDSILTQSPSWYGGSNTSAFSAGYLASGLSSASQSFGSSFESSSGSSGGSGGGGGGGGGGGW